MRCDISHDNFMLLGLGQNSAGSWGLRVSYYSWLLLHEKPSCLGKSSYQNDTFMQVLQAAIKALDDKKRAVRQEAVRCRQTWCVHFAGWSFYKFCSKQLLIALWIVFLWYIQAVVCLRSALAVVWHWKLASCLLADPVGTWVSTIGTSFGCFNFTLGYCNAFLV